MLRLSLAHCFCLSSIVSAGALAHAQQGVIEIASLDPTGVDAGLASGAIVSADGRFVLFQSSGAYVPDDTNGVLDAFVHDRFSGATERASLGPGGAQLSSGLASAFAPTLALSGDGRLVAFVSADGLVANDTNAAADIYVRDQVTGEVELESVGFGGVGANAWSKAPSFSRDGRFLAFYSVATNLTATAPRDPGQMYVRDRTLGTTVLVSVGWTGTELLGVVYPGRISGDGLRVCFAATSPDAVPGDTNGVTDLFVRDLAAGTTERVNLSSAEAEANAACSIETEISFNGRFVLFSSSATSLVSDDTLGHIQLFVRDRASGTTELVSRGPFGAGNGSSYAGAVADSGRFVAFVSLASNLVGNDLLITQDDFVRDRQLGTTRVVSHSPSGACGNDSSGDASMSSDGRWIAFSSFASNLLPYDTDGTSDVFVEDAHSVDLPELCSANGLSCPCANATLEVGGCANSFGREAFLRASGSASVAQDTLVLFAHGLPPTASTLFFQGTATVNAGAGSPFGDGLRCVGGSVLRLGSFAANAGVASIGYGIAGTPSVSVTGQVPSAGGARFYQAWYRNSASFCTSATFNLTNGVQVTWSP